MSFAHFLLYLSICMVKQNEIFKQFITVTSSCHLGIQNVVHVEEVYGVNLKDLAASLLSFSLAKGYNVGWF